MRARSAKYGSMYEAVFMWFKECVAMNVPVNGPLMMQKATELVQAMETVDGRHWDGWLHRLALPRLSFQEDFVVNLPQ